MANALTTDSAVTCAFHGTAQLTSKAKLHVNGAPVLLAKDATSWPMSGCQQVTGNTSTPCVTLFQVTNGAAAKLTSDGSPVLLDSLTATTSPVATTHNASASGGQSKVTAS
jgi:hypothetical protein